MTENYSQEERSADYLLDASETVLRETAEGLAATMDAVRSGHLKEVASAVIAVRDLRQAFTTVMMERDKVDKLRKQVAGAVGTGTLDLHAARDEIGRRLALLRAAAGSE
ncbi:MAG: hypothetical protein ACEQSU_12270 [Microgenomates group bacterium]|jgi:hypothetical protein